MAERTEAEIKRIANEQMTVRFNDYASQNREFSSFELAVRRWLQNELPQMGPYDAVCDYGKAVHNAGRIVIDGYIDSRDNHKLVEFVQGIVRDMQESDSRERSGMARSMSVDDRVEPTAESTAPQADVTIVMKAWFRASYNTGGEAALPSTIASMHRHGEFSGEVVDTINSVQGLYRFKNVPSEWLQELARNGSFVHDIRTGGSSERNTVTFSSRV